MFNRYGTGRPVHRTKMLYALKGECTVEAEVYAGSPEEAEDYFNDYFKSVLDRFPEITFSCTDLREVWD